MTLLRQLSVMITHDFDLDDDDDDVEETFGDDHDCTFKMTSIFSKSSVILTLLICIYSHDFHY